MRIAFIGLGIMGLPMATNISKSYDVIGYDVIEKKTPFPFASSYEEAVKGSDVIISMVPKNEHAIALYQTLTPLLSPGQTCIEMSTIAPSVHQKIASELEARGIDVLDCPVVKSQPAAIKGELGIYVGGKKDVFEKMKPILSCMGKNIIYLGGHGAGLTMKILHNGLVGEIQNGVNEILSLACRSGLDLPDVVTALSYGGAQCFYLDTKAKNIIANEYPTAFSVSNMNKDVHFALELAQEKQMECPSLSNVVKVYEEAMKEGYGSEDFSASYKVVNR